MDWLWFVIAGIFGGVIGGMGMGGGTLLIPILIFFLNVEQLQAQWLNLIAFIPMAIVVILIHKKNSLIKLQGIKSLFITGILSSIIFAFVANNMDSGILNKLFGGFLILMAVLGVVTTFVTEKKQNKSS